jgi:hypothetical protein
MYNGFMYKDIDISVFPPERKEKLEKIYRYSFFDTMLYRSNLWMHTQRVLWLLEEVAPIAKKHLTFDLEKARIYALVHDDAEMITGDIQAIVKLRMTTEETKKLEEEEMNAIENLIQNYPEKVHGYSYKELLEHATKKDCVEAQLVSYLDKLDAFCESLHEVYAGNISLLRSVVFYSMTLPLFSIKYPDLKEFLLSKESPFTYISDQISPLEIKAEKYKTFGKPHTEKTIFIDTDFPFYRKWKQIVIEKGKINWLINQKEFLS